MSILYEDRYVVCDDVAMTIKAYYFPLGSKRIAYSDIREVSEKNLGPLGGQFRIWGMGFEPYWYHYDAQRMSKNKEIVLDLGNPVNPILTPEDHDLVFQLLQEKIRGDV